MNNNVIIMDDIETYPKLLLDYLNDIDPVEEFPKVDNLTLDVFQQYDTYLYHCTRLNNKNDILEQGLRRIAYSHELQEHFICVLQEVFNNEYDFKNWIDKYKYSDGRGKTLHFTGTISYMKYTKGCLPFFQSFGGEILLEIIRENLRLVTNDQAEFDNKLKLYKHKLKNIGQPYLVKIKIPIKELDIIDFSSLIGKLNRFCKGYTICGEKHIPCIGKVFKRDISFNEILDITEVKLLNNDFI